MAGVTRTRTRCDACGASASIDGGEISIEGRSLWLCSRHAAELSNPVPASLEEAERRLSDGSLERRSVPDRRSAPDRRMFPPRPEGRRSSHGRRVCDPEL